MAQSPTTTTASTDPSYSSLPSTMKAYTQTSFTTPRAALTFHPSHPLPDFTPPSTSPTALLLRVTHAALNPADLAILRFLPPLLTRPLRGSGRSSPVPGLDFAGVIVAVGDAVPKERGLAVGDRVCGAMGLREVAGGRGSLAGYVVVESGLVVKVPEVEGWGAREAVGVMGIAGQTAAEMVRYAGAGFGGGVEAGGWEGRRVLVNGASGGVGTIAVQVLKGLGAEVVGVCSGGNRGLVERLGAAEVSVCFAWVGRKGWNGC